MFGKLWNILENKELQCVGKLPDYYATLQRNFSIHNFSRESVDPEFHYGINDGQEVVVDIPDGLV